MKTRFRERWTLEHYVLYGLGILTAIPGVVFAIVSKSLASDVRVAIGVGSCGFLLAAVISGIVASPKKWLKNWERTKNAKE